MERAREEVEPQGRPPTAQPRKVQPAMLQQHPPPPPREYFFLFFNFFSCFQFYLKRLCKTMKKTYNTEVALMFTVYNVQTPWSFAQWINSRPPPGVGRPLPPAAFWHHRWCDYRYCRLQLVLRVLARHQWVMA
jgi:hypothetical protein